MGLKRDAALALFAERQQGHVTRAQALAAGMGAGAFQGRIDRGYLYRVHRGVYRVGHTALSSSTGRWALFSPAVRERWRATPPPRTSGRSGRARMARST